MGNIMMKQSATNASIKNRTLSSTICVDTGEDLEHLARITTIEQIPCRGTEDNPNHHIWLNNGCWALSIIVCPTPCTKERIRVTLRTKCVITARKRRDMVLARLGVESKFTEFNHVADANLEQTDPSELGQLANVRDEKAGCRQPS